MNIKEFSFDATTGKFKKKFLEFYITNVCNYNCDNCNRLNNYYFSGHERWDDYKEDYRAWSEKLDVENILILGGEPLLHPELLTWVKGIRSLWPKSNITIISNGSRLGYWHQRGLFDVLSSTQTKLDISLHNRSRRESLLNEIVSNLPDPEFSIFANSGGRTTWTDAYNDVKDPSWPMCESYSDFNLLPQWIQDECTNIHKISWNDWLTNTGKTEIRDRSIQDLVITLSYSENFVTAPLKYTGDNKFSVYNSDPERAHEICWSKHCTHMMHGKMYKCHHVALLPEFSKQFTVGISPEDQQLIDAYEPLESSTDQPTMQMFLQNLSEPMPQCKLCPSKLDPIFLQSGTDKPKVKKIIPITDHACGQ
jgi:organic radical activating enzyme